MNDRDKLWSAAYAIIEGLKSRFGMWTGTAENIAYKNIYNKDGKGLTDEEIANVVANLKAIINA